MHGLLCFGPELDSCLSVCTIEITVLFLIQHLWLYYSLIYLYLACLLGFQIWPAGQVLLPVPAVQQVTLVKFLMLTAALASHQAPAVSPSGWYTLLALLKTSSTLHWTRASLWAKPLVDASCCLSLSPASIPSSFSLYSFPFSTFLLPCPILPISSLPYPAFLILSFHSLSPLPFFLSTFLFFPFILLPSFSFPI